MQQFWAVAQAQAYGGPVLYTTAELYILSNSGRAHPSEVSITNTAATVDRVTSALNVHTGFTPLVTVFLTEENHLNSPARWSFNYSQDHTK